MSEQNTPNSEELRLFLGYFFFTYGRVYFERDESAVADLMLLFAQHAVDADFPYGMALRALWEQRPESREELRDAIEKFKNEHASKPK